MKSFYMQDKRARKRTPPIGTKKYPMYYLGEGWAENRTIKTNGRWPYEMKIEPKSFRFYGADEREGVWFKNISTVELGYYWSPKNIPED